jgi:Spy/CpxP family protein refolding chaperone
VTKTKTLLLLSFILVFAAGAVVGTVQRVAGQHEGPPSGPPPHRDGGGGPRDHDPLPKILNLTPEQQQQMAAIWSDHMKRRDQERPLHDQKRREYQSQRDEAIRALLTPDQLPKYDAIRKDYQDRMTEIDAQRQAAFKQAVEETKKILTPEQVTKYEEFLATHRPPDGAPGGDRRGNRGGPSTSR